MVLCITMRPPRLSAMHVVLKVKSILDAIANLLGLIILKSKFDTTDATVEYLTIVRNNFLAHEVNDIFLVQFDDNLPKSHIYIDAQSDICEQLFIKRPAYHNHLKKSSIPWQQVH